MVISMLQWRLILHMCIHGLSNFSTWQREKAAKVYLTQENSKLQQHRGECCTHP